MATVDPRGTPEPRWLYADFAFDTASTTTTSTTITSTTDSDPEISRTEWGEGFPLGSASNAVDTIPADGTDGTTVTGPAAEWLEMMRETQRMEETRWADRYVGSGYSSPVTTSYAHNNPYLWMLDIMKEDNAPVGCIGYSEKRDALYIKVSDTRWHFLGTRGCSFDDIKVGEKMKAEDPKKGSEIETDELGMGFKEDDGE